MKLISPFLKHLAYPCLSMAGYLHRHARDGQLAVVTYHGVEPTGYMSRDRALDGNLISVDTFRAQLRFLKSRYHVISPEGMWSWIRSEESLPPLSILLTCDDGLLNCLTDMLPVLQQEGVRCLFFVTGASTGESRSMLWYEELFLLFARAPAGRFEIECEGMDIHGRLASREERRVIWWSSVKRLSQVSAEIRATFLRAASSQFLGNGMRVFEGGDQASCRRFGLLTVGELRELAAGGMTIGAHTLSHPMLSQAPVELARAEIAGSKAELEAALQTPVWALAYPFGDPGSVTPQVLAMAEEVGFAAAFVNFGGGFGTELPRYSLPRIHVTAGMSLSEFEAHVSGFYTRLHRMGRRATHSDVVADHAANG